MMFALWLIHLLIRNAAIVDVGLGRWPCDARDLLRGGGPRLSRAQIRDRRDGRLLGISSRRPISYLRACSVIPRKAATCNFAKSGSAISRCAFFSSLSFRRLLDVVLSAPFLIACLDIKAPLGLLEKIGAGIWLVSMLGEAIADQQLHNFKKNPANAGKTCRAGLWRYSRHPNYFFEWMIWVGYAVFALGSPWGWIGLISPALILYFLLGATGIPATEAQALRSRGDEYREYQRTTSSFVPWFPKKTEARS